MTTIWRGTAGSFWICRVVQMQIWTHSLVVSISLSQSRSPPWTQTSKLHFVSLLKTSYSQGPTDNTSLDDNLFLFDLVNVINFQRTFVFLPGEFHFLKGSSDESDPPISLPRLFSYFYHRYRILAFRKMISSQTPDDWKLFKSSCFLFRVLFKFLSKAVNVSHGVSGRFLSSHQLEGGWSLTRHPICPVRHLIFVFVFVFWD